MSVAYLDTHIAVYLYNGLIEELSPEAVKQIEGNDLLLSPMVVLEFAYLFERKRIGVEAGPMVYALDKTFGIGVCSLPFVSVADEAVAISWTSDPFDRLIVANAAVNHRAPLITRDRRIRKNYSGAVW